jgi:hypothetical protein
MYAELEGLCEDGVDLAAVLRSRRRDIWRRLGAPAAGAKPSWKGQNGAAPGRAVLSTPSCKRRKKIEVGALIRAIIEAVAEEFNLFPREIAYGDRNPDLLTPRAVAFFLTRERIGVPAEALEAFHISHRGTFSYHSKNIIKRMETDLQLAGVIGKLREAIQARVGPARCLLLDDVDVLERMRREYPGSISRHPPIGLIIQFTARDYGVTSADILGPSQLHAIVQPRFVAIHLAREMTEKSTPKIGKYLGGRDHSTVMNAAARTKKSMLDDQAFAARVEALRVRIEAAFAPFRAKDASGRAPSSLEQENITKHQCLNRSAELTA